MNRIYRRGSKNRKIKKSVGRKTPYDDTLHKEQTLNGFNVIELNEEEINLDMFSDLTNLSEREIDRIKKKAQSIEGYYLGKGEDAKINENCFNCLMKDFQANELLYFAKRKDLLIYLRYCFYFLKKILFIDNQIYTENKYDLDKCNTNYLNGWKFFIPKTMCKGCFLQMINMEHLFGNLKTIFSDVDVSSFRRNFRRNRSHLNPRIRIGHSIQKNENENKEQPKKRGFAPNLKRKTFKKNFKNNKNITFDDKNGLILLKKNILSEDLVENLKENDKKNKFLGKKKKPGEKIFGEQMVTEIKIKTKEFLNGTLAMKEANNGEKNNLIKNNKDIKTDASEKTIENTNINNSDIIHNNKISIKMRNISPLENTNQNIINNKEDINHLIANKEKIPINIFHDIMISKGMNNKTVLKLYYKLDTFLNLIYNALIDVSFFREKLNNTLNLNPIIIANLGPGNLSKYERNYRIFYNQLFKDRKEFEEIFKKIKNDSIASIAKNLSKLKEQTNLKEEEIKTLDEMKQSLDGYTNQINELEKKYNFQIKNYFTDFNCFLNLIGEIKESFAN